MSDISQTRSNHSPDSNRNRNADLANTLVSACNTLPDFIQQVREFRCLIGGVNSATVSTVKKFTAIRTAIGELSEFKNRAIAGDEISPSSIRHSREILKVNLFQFQSAAKLLHSTLSELTAPGSFADKFIASLPNLTSSNLNQTVRLDQRLPSLRGLPELFAVGLRLSSRMVGELENLGVPEATKLEVALDKMCASHRRLTRMIGAILGTRNLEIDALFPIDAMRDSAAFELNAMRKNGVPIGIFLSQIKDTVQGISDFKATTWEVTTPEALSYEVESATLLFTLLRGISVNLDIATQIGIITLCSGCSKLEQLSLESVSVATEAEILKFPTKIGRKDPSKPSSPPIAPKANIEGLRDRLWPK